MGRAEKVFQARISFEFLCLFEQLPTKIIKWHGKSGGIGYPEFPTCPQTLVYKLQMASGKNATRQKLVSPTIQAPNALQKCARRREFQNVRIVREKRPKWRHPWTHLSYHEFFVISMLRHLGLRGAAAMADLASERTGESGWRRFANLTTVGSNPGLAYY